MDSVGKVRYDTNLYSYGGNNPINYLDQLGLTGISIGFDVAGAAFGFGGMGGLYGNFSLDPISPLYSGWSSSVTFVLGASAAASAYLFKFSVYH